MTQDPNFDWLKYARDQKIKAAELQMEASKALANAEYGEALYKAQQYGAKPAPSSSSSSSAPAQGQQPAAEAEAPRCADCGTEIKGSSDGKYSAQNRAEWSVRDYGNIFCFKCKDKHQKRS